MLLHDLVGQVCDRSLGHDAAAVQAETTTTGQDPERRVDIFLDR